jgi:hypothetical protein
MGTLIALLILKYYVEGENNMPFEISKIMVISTAEGIDVSEGENSTKWNFNISQNNDIYMEISKNKNYKETEIIDKIIIDNFNVEQEPSKGKIAIYKPTKSEDVTYENKEEYKIDNNIIYIGSEGSSIKNLEIANQGGIILFRYAIENIGNYNSEDEEIKHDGTILSKIGMNYEELKCKVSFEISIKLKSEITYTGTVELELPAGNIIDEGTSYYEKTDLSDIIFKRNLK